MTEQPVRTDAADPATEEAQVRRVVGLKYAPEDGLPQVILKGAGPLAEEILRRRNGRIGPQVVKNEALLQSLYRLPLDSPIGPELFQVVAVILAHVFALEAKLKRGNDG